MGTASSTCTGVTDADSEAAYEHGKRTTPTRGGRATRAAAVSGAGPPKMSSERTELLMEIRALRDGVDRSAELKESSDDYRSKMEARQRRRRERVREDSELPSKTLDEVKKIKQGLESEYAKASAREEAEKKEMFTRSNARRGTPQEALRSFNKDNYSRSDPSQAASSGSRHPPPPQDTLPRDENLLEVALKDTTLLLGPDLFCSNDAVSHLTWDNTWSSDPAGPRDEAHRRQVRLSTKEKVAKELGLSFFGEPASMARHEPPQLRKSILFRDVREEAQLGMAAAGGLNLLGRYDVCCVRAVADLDRKWRYLKGMKQDFWVAHVAAVNIGESLMAADFPDFQKLDNTAAMELDEWKYIEAMGHVMDNIVTVCTKMSIKHMVFFPLGMGAFLRHLGHIDHNFTQDEEMLRLRRALAVRMVQSWAKLPKDLKVHLCLQFSTEEAQRNADAFLRALVGDPAFDKPASPIKDRVVVIPEGDALDVASTLASKWSDGVLLVNGANRQLIGNHWFAGRAKMAIDENLHRRSWRLSAVAYLLNDFDGEQDLPQRPKDALAMRMTQLGGKVVDLSSDSSLSELGGKAMKALGLFGRES